MTSSRVDLQWSKIEHSGRPRVISIQSQVVHGHVGNSAALFPLQLLGCDVAAVPTVLLSNHPHYETMHGGALSATQVESLLTGAAERGYVGPDTIILSGYLGTSEIALVVEQFVTWAKARYPTLRYCCDPVIGDHDTGIYVDAALPAILRERLIPHADIITPNLFELECVLGAKLEMAAAIAEGHEVLGKARGLSLIVTGCQLSDTPATMLDTLLLDKDGMLRLRTPRLNCRPAGTGDLLTAMTVAGLATGRMLRGALAHAVAASSAVLRCTLAAGSAEMQIAGSAAELLAPSIAFDVTDLQETASVTRILGQSGLLRSGEQRHDPGPESPRHAEIAGQNNSADQHHLDPNAH